MDPRNQRFLRRNMYSANRPSGTRTSAMPSTMLAKSNTVSEQPEHHQSNATNNPVTGASAKLRSTMNVHSATTSRKP